MTFDEAKKIFINKGFVNIDGINIFDGNKWREACVVISEWLQNEECEDAISRQAALECLDWKYPDKLPKTKIMELPPVTPLSQEPKTGHWITAAHGFPHEPTSVCSECGFDRDFYIRTRGFDKIKYCPNCGFRMVEPQESEG